MQDILLPAQHARHWDLVAIIKEITTLYQPLEEARILIAVSSFRPPYPDRLCLLLDLTQDDASSSSLAFLSSVLPSLWATLSRWISSLFDQEPPREQPDLYSPFFFLGRNGTASYFGKKVLTAATLCLHSVGKLSRHQAVLKLCNVRG
jgi:hypothetical protein